MDRTTEQGRPTPPGLVPTTRPRDSASTKLKWNMVLQHTTAASAAAASLSRSASKQQMLVDSRTPSPLLGTRDNGTQPTITASSDTTKEDTFTDNGSSDKKGSVDSSASGSSGSTVDSLRSSLGFDWKVIGAPSGAGGGAVDQPSGHSRERALSLLERVSGAHLTDEYPPSATANAAVPPYSARTTRGYSVFSPFGESGFDFTPSSATASAAVGYAADDYQGRHGYGYQPQQPQQPPYYQPTMAEMEHRSAPSSRASSPAINHHLTHHQQQQQQQQPQGYPFYAPQPTATSLPFQQQHQLMQQQQYMQQYHQETMRRQSVMEHQMGMMGMMEYQQPLMYEQPAPYNPRHRPSLSYGGSSSATAAAAAQSMPPRNSISGGRAFPTNTPSPPAAAHHLQYQSRRSSVPHRQQQQQLESEMAAMGFYNDPHPQMAYYEPVPQTSGYHPNYYQQSPPTFVPSIATPPPAVTNTNNNTSPPQQNQHQQQEQSQPLQLSAYRGPMYAVEFKAGRTEVFYVVEGSGVQRLSVGEWVIVEADRGEDLGKVTSTITIDRLKQLMSMTADVTHPDDIDRLAGQVEPELAAILYAKEIVPKPVHRVASPSDLKALQAKAQEEAIAMVRCQSRIRQKRLPMEVVDAEYQWDRNKLTFYFQSDKRIDFRELVRDLFRIYKTRIWMCAVDKNRLAALAEMRKSMDMEAVHAAAMAADAALGPE